jgi:hypothetical protein
MNTLQSFLRSSVIWMELLAALVGFYHLFKYHQSPWKWFVYYLLLMFVFESVSYFFLDPFAGFRKYYYGGNSYSIFIFLLAVCLCFIE